MVGRSHQPARELLALRDDAGHVASMEAHGIGPIDLLVTDVWASMGQKDEAEERKAEALEGVFEELDGPGGRLPFRAGKPNGVPADDGPGLRHLADAGNPGSEP